MARPLVLSDASPLIALGAVGLLSLLRALFSAVRTTATVHAEVVPGTDPPQPGEREIEAAVRAKWLRILKRDWSEPDLSFLDPGEASVLRAAAHSRGPCLILLDDLPARAVAKQMGFQITGTAGLLLVAKRRHLLPAVRPVFERLLEHDFRLSADLIKAVLSEAGEI